MKVLLIGGLNQVWPLTGNYAEKQGQKICVLNMVCTDVWHVLGQFDRQCGQWPGQLKVFQLWQTWVGWRKVLPMTNNMALNYFFSIWKLTIFCTLKLYEIGSPCGARIFAPVCRGPSAPSSQSLKCNVDRVRQLFVKELFMSQLDIVVIYLLSLIDTVPTYCATYVFQSFRAVKSLLLIANDKIYETEEILPFPRNDNPYI